jgi:hypothetical protein
MNHQIIKNIESVRTEMYSVLENIGRTKGNQYRGVVHSLVMASNCVDMFDIAISMATDDPDEKTLQLRDLFLSSLFGSLHKACTSSGIEEELLCDAMEDAIAISQSAQHLTSTAVKAGKEGRSFG